MRIFVYNELFIYKQYCLKIKVQPLNFMYTIIFLYYTWNGSQRARNNPVVMAKARPYLGGPG